MTDNPSTQVIVAQPAQLTDLACKPADVLRAAALIQEVMAAVMKDGEHYGIVPGTEKTDAEGRVTGKKSLFKSGAEKLCFTFGLSNKLDIKLEPMPGGHREYTIICNLYDRAGALRGQGVGSASTMESKYRYRGAAGKPCPSCGALAAKPSKKEYGGGYYCDQKAGGGCGWKTKAGTAEAKALDAVPNTRKENPDPADTYNTVLKMAKKRALVDAVLTATAASDCFAQDLEDLEDEIRDADAKDAASRPAAPQAARTATKDEAPAKDVAPTVPAKEQKPAKPDMAPELMRGRDLWQKIEAQAKGTGTKVLARLAALHGAASPQAIAAGRLAAFGKDVDALAEDPTPERIEDLLSQWEQAAREGAASNEGAQP
jgi:hypothetical protein